jgi:hypothetical protein
MWPAATASTASENLDAHNPDEGRNGTTLLLLDHVQSTSLGAAFLAWDWEKKAAEFAPAAAAAFSTSAM